MVRELKTLLHRVIEGSTRWLERAYTVREGSRVLGHIGWYRGRPFFIPADGQEFRPDDSSSPTAKFVREENNEQ